MGIRCGYAMYFPKIIWNLHNCSRRRRRPRSTTNTLNDECLFQMAAGENTSVHTLNFSNQRLVIA
jgi:hypothetical protein